jgi:hypothetical protein
MNQFVLWVQIVVVSISLMRRHILYDKIFGTCCSLIEEHIFWIFLKDCTKKLEKKNEGLLQYMMLKFVK